MIQQPRPRGRRLWSLAAWSLGIGLAWLLLGQQYAGQPAVYLDLTAGLPGAATTHWQTSPPSSPGTSTSRSTGTSPPQQHSPATSPATSTGTSTRNSQAAARAVAFALSQQGKPYEFGAEGPDTYDCSGLTWRAWQHAGLNWERMSAAGQWQWLQQHGRDVAATQLHAGDLLFFANNPTTPPRSTTSPWRSATAAWSRRPRPESPSAWSRCAGSTSTPPPDPLTDHPSPRSANQREHAAMDQQPTPRSAAPPVIQRLSEGEPVLAFTVPNEPALALCPKGSTHPFLARGRRVRDDHHRHLHGPGRRLRRRQVRHVLSRPRRRRPAPPRAHQYYHVDLL